VEGTVNTLAALAKQAGLTPPAVAVIGSVVGLRSQLNWFESRPLFGQRVVVTRASDQAAELSDRLREVGAEVLEVPCIKIVPPSVRTALVEALAGLHGYDWLVFTSANGVTMFFDAFFKAFSDLRDLGGVRLAAVGPATRAQLEALHLHVDVMPREYVAKEVARALAAEGSLENLRILLPRAEAANPELPRLLEELGAIVDDVPCYQTVVETSDATGHAARMLREGAEWVTFTSGSTVRHFHQRFDLPAFIRQHPQVRLASVGPETTKALEELKLKPAVEARPHTIAGLVAAMLAKPRRRPRG
jgi:uroporphyrinogen III methyltransferase/synthase